MADGDFLDIQNQLASLVGAESITSLPDVEQRRIKKLINQAYREMYLGVDGKKPRWASKEYSFRVPAPLTVTGTVTQYTNAVTVPTGALTGWGHAAGSTAKCNGKWYKVSHVDVESDTLYLLDDFLDATGSHSFTLYQSGFRLPNDVVTVCGTPELVGVGPLSPMSSKDEELRYRSSHVSDFAPVGAPFNRPTITYSGNEYEVGTPIWYYADTSRIEGAGEVGGSTTPVDVAVRFNLYPIPDKSFTVRLRANIIPDTVTENTATFLLPGNVVDDILLPIARAKLAMVDPRYNGNNATFIMRDLEEARNRLKALAEPQKQKHAALTIRPRW